MRSASATQMSTASEQARMKRRRSSSAFSAPPSQRSMWQSNSTTPFQPQLASVRNIHTVSLRPSGPTRGGKSSSN